MEIERVVDRERKREGDRERKKERDIVKRKTEKGRKQTSRSSEPYNTRIVGNWLLAKTKDLVDKLRVRELEILTYKRERNIKRQI